MQLNPRYGSDPLIVLDGDPAAIAEPVIRQRRRLAETLASFTDEQWFHPSRCTGWTNRDVIVHLDSTNTFWSFSIGAGLADSPTTFLSSFDPVASPAALVAGSGSSPPEEVLASFMASNTALIQLLYSIDGDGWSMLAESPPGHVSISAVAHHAIWDSWIHERDIALPLGLSPAEEPDEVVAGLRYAAALGPALAISRGARESGRVTLTVTDPSTSLVVEFGDRVKVRNDSGAGSTTSPPDAAPAGSAVALLEALSVRRPFPSTTPPAVVAALNGLEQEFES